MKNKFYVEEQPGKSILAIILVDEVPLSQEAHERLGELSEVSDLLFIIKENKNISARKFGSLYQACCWTLAASTDSEAIMEALEYDREIFGNHVLVLISSVSCITELKGEVLQKIAASSITKPILKTRRLTSAEFFEIYKNERKESWLNRYLDLPLPPSENLDDLYTTHTVESKEVLLRGPVIGRMIDFWKTDKEDGTSGEGYVCSFKRPGFCYFLASILKKLRLGELEINPENL